MPFYIFFPLTVEYRVSPGMAAKSTWAADCGLDRSAVVTGLQKRLHLLPQRRVLINNLERDLAAARGRLPAFGLQQLSQALQGRQLSALVARRL